MKYTVETQRKIWEGNPGIKIIYFWGHTPTPGIITMACFSQWYDCTFEVDGILYHTTEQYMMAGKARLFGDTKVLEEIMQASTPNRYKKLGRKVGGFDPKVWNEHKYDIVVKGNLAKFGQNPEFAALLLSTGDALIAEASPYDKIWGIGMGRTEALRSTPMQWKGENLLGCVLMDVRDRLRDADTNA